MIDSMQPYDCLILLLHIHVYVMLKGDKGVDDLVVEKLLN